MSTAVTVGRNGREASVHSRYSVAARMKESHLCCPVRYPREYLEVIPAEILERDYGCGDPTRYVRKGDMVLDLGSGGGKACYILSQVVGPEGRVIGVDSNREMLALARRYREQVAQRLGFDNVQFRCGLIQDLALDLEELAREAGGMAIAGPQDWITLRQLEQRLRYERPMIASESVDCVVSNCVLNLVRPEDRRQLFAEIFRVLRSPGGCRPVRLQPPQTPASARDQGARLRRDDGLGGHVPGRGNLLLSRKGEHDDDAYATSAGQPAG